MLNPNVPVKKWFGGQVATLTSLPVYDGFAPDDAPNEYVVMDGRNGTQEQGKTGFTTPVVIILDIVTKSANFGYKRAEEISSLIMAGINSDTVVNLDSGFEASSLVIDSIRNLDGLNPMDNVFRVLLTYNLTVTQTL